MPASFRANFVIFKMGPSETSRSMPLPLAEIGNPSLVHVYVTDIGLAFATMATCNDSPSMPTTVYDGGVTNFGGSIRNERTNEDKIKRNKIEITQHGHENYLCEFNLIVSRT